MDQSTKDIFSARIYAVEAIPLGFDVLGFDPEKLSGLDPRLNQLLSQPFIVTGTIAKGGLLLTSKKEWGELRPLIQQLPSMNRGARLIKESMLTNDRLCQPEQVFDVSPETFSSVEPTENFDVLVFDENKAEIWPSKTWKRHYL